jgi:predicted Fe-Mo cluster-binding NifX family protein
VKIAVPALGPDTRSAVAPTFARCPYFVVVDDDRHDVETIKNAGGELDSGASTGSVQLLADAGVGTVLAHRCGPHAARALAAAGIIVSLGHTGTVDEIVETFTAGLLQ